MTFISYGSSAAQGISVGAIHVVRQDRPDVVESRLEEGTLDLEKKRFSEAIDRTKHYLRGVKNKIPRSAGKEIDSVIDTHIQIVSDETLLEGVNGLITKNKCNSEWALQVYQDELISVFEGIRDMYFEARKADICHVIDLLLTNLNSEGIRGKSSSKFANGMVIVAKDLSPSELITFFRGGIAGFFTELGTPTSHTSILARSIGIPAVTGIPHALKLFRENDSVIIDGNEGVVIGNPTTDILGEYIKKITLISKKKKRPPGERVAKDSITADGEKIKISFNLDMVDDYRNLLEYGIHSIGLFRTEFLFLNRADYPTEEEHLACYKKVLTSLRKQDFTIRTADIVTDKLPQQLHSSGPGRMLSALGLRGLRFSLREPKVFLPQLRAIIRASGVGRVRLMLPMVTDLKEIDSVQEHIRKIRKEYEFKGIDFDRNMPIGAMIEVPAAAAAAPLFAKRLDFLSIGSNDLIQYANAADRQNSEVAYLYQPLHFGVIRLLSWVVSAGSNEKKPVSICGEIASDLRFTPLLLGLGLNELSVRPTVFYELQERIGGICVSESKRKVEHFLESGDPMILDSLVSR